MSSLSDRLGTFAAALLDPALPAPAGLVGPDGLPSVRRFAVYRNNVVVGLVEALKANHPACCRIVGEEFFGAMARLFVLAEPPTSPVLLGYGSGLADFIAGFEPLAALPYLADVARLERAYLEAYHAAEAAPIDVADLAVIPADAVACLTLRLHPSARLLASPHPVLTIFRMNVGDGIPAQIDPDAGGENVLVLRAAADVELRLVENDEVAFLEAILTGGGLAEATKAALGVSPRFDLETTLGRLLAAGALVGVGIATEASLLEVRT